MKFEVFQGKNGQFYFRLVSGNYKTVATSEGYTQKKSVLKTIKSIYLGMQQIESVTVFDLTGKEIDIKNITELTI